MIAKHKIYRFSFLDNDVIGNDWERFSTLLDKLSSIKDDFPDFQIILAEIITKDIKASIIRKMALAGFTNVQIGYESASNELLKKINKKNSFASNFLFIKYAYKYGISLGGVNIIRGLLEENVDDILESIENLRVFRFFYNHGRFRHQMTNLGVMNSSRYYQDIKDNSHDFKQIDTVELLPKDYVTLGELNNCCITEKNCFVEKNTWAHFSLVEAYYLKAHYMYKLYGKDKSFVYQEFLNDEMINALEIEYNSIEYVILKKSNESVLLFNDLLKLVKSTAKDTITDCEIYNILEELKREGLIYTPYDYSEIVSIIDIDSII